MALLVNVEGTYQPFAPPGEVIKYPDHRAWKKCERKIYIDLPPESGHSESKRAIVSTGQIKTLLMSVYDMGQYKVGQGYLYAMLVLQQVNRATNTYKRIGYMTLETRKGFDVSSLPLGLIGNEEILHIV
ncbi:uncharacterized protein J4E87_006281 [Alternaria ethzedia]|uniref:uncharacterized protein n=1 Tax=Alternaria ethzedia TaxID=181014 RepID=UPI0020C39FAE|nr:uncharacterized protein J4E87_006281 [Alternaria ethzedia]KAI4622714.1 hypothetical protein J4E87_006281 [Alternaria ethzedia]